MEDQTISPWDDSVKENFSSLSLLQNIDHSKLKFKKTLSNQIIQTQSKQSYYLTLTNPALYQLDKEKQSSSNLVSKDLNKILSNLRESKQQEEGIILKDIQRRQLLDKFHRKSLGVYSDYSESSQNKKVHETQDLNQSLASGSPKNVPLVYKSFQKFDKLHLITNLNSNYPKMAFSCFRRYEIQLLKIKSKNQIFLNKRLPGLKKNLTRERIQKCSENLNKTCLNKKLYKKQKKILEMTNNNMGLNQESIFQTKNHQIKSNLSTLNKINNFKETFQNFQNKNKILLNELEKYNLFSLKIFQQKLQKS